MNKFFLTRREDFRAVARRGRRKTGVFWSLRYQPVKAKQPAGESAQAAGARAQNANVNHARFAVSVSKRHLRRATLRNRLRRVLRESFRQAWAHELYACDYLVASAARFAKSGEDELRGECRRLLVEASGFLTRKAARRERHEKAEAKKAAKKAAQKA